MMKRHTVYRMPKIKIAVTVDETALARLDRLVAAGRFANRSQAIESAILDKVASAKQSRLAAECEKLDPAEEQADAELGFEEDSATWPEY
jgi:Arc/MetJ-type ribon-helix-helix transcriptional regulator